MWLNCPWKGDGNGLQTVQVACPNSLLYRLGVRVNTREHAKCACGYWTRKAFGINNAGQVVLQNGVYANGTLTAFPTGFACDAINSSGAVAGFDNGLLGRNESRIL